MYKIKENSVKLVGHLKRKDIGIKYKKIKSFDVSEAFNNGMII